ncbi:MAG: hypothetical protein H7061_14035 [Bdellovibrionaceae bacterium]|nr:hypothetical protein [Bdellovibrio sp.]
MQKTKLLFIKSPSHNLKAIENYLTKRSYNVIFETDFDASLVKIESLAPDFIFIAWDHPNPQVQNLPKIILEQAATPIVPYIDSKGHEAIRRLEFSGFSDKLFPPLSGPAIERIILRTLKIMAADETFALGGDKLSPPAEQSETRSNLLVTAAGPIFEDSPAFKKSRSEVLTVRNAALQNSVEKSMPRDLIEKLRVEFKKTLLQNFEDTIAAYHDQASPAKSEIDGDSIMITPSVESDEALTAELEQVRRNALQAESSPSITNPHKSIYCVTIYSSTWCGYLVAYSDFETDFSMAQYLFRSWLARYFEDLQPFEESEQFEINITQTDYNNWAQQTADYSERVNFNNKEIILSFFTAAPEVLSVDLQEKDLIGVPIELIPADKNLPLSFFLHLPENKKFLLYTPLNQKLEKTQLSRLAEKRVKKLFTPVQYEKEYRILRAENFLSALTPKMKNGV